MLIALAEADIPHQRASEALPSTKKCHPGKSFLISPIHHRGKKRQDRLKYSVEQLLGSMVDWI